MYKFSEFKCIKIVILSICNYEKYTKAKITRLHPTYIHTKRFKKKAATDSFLNIGIVTFSFLLWISLH